MRISNFLETRYLWVFIFSSSFNGSLYSASLLSVFSFHLLWKSSHRASLHARLVFYLFSIFRSPKVGAVSKTFPSPSRLMTHGRLKGRPEPQIYEGRGSLVVHTFYCNTNTSTLASAFHDSWDISRLSVEAFLMLLQFF